jgi:hypothetical protein
MLGMDIGRLRGESFSLSIQGMTRFTTLTLLVGVDRADMSFQVFTAIETFSAILHFAHIYTCNLFGALLVIGWRLGRHSAPPAFLCEIRHGDRKNGT